MPRSFEEEVVHHNRIEIVARAEFLEIYTTEDEYNDSISLSFDQASRTTPYVADSGVVIDVEVDSYRIDGFMVPFRRGWLESHGEQLAQHWEQRFSQQTGLTKIFLQLAMEAFPALTTDIRGDWEGRHLSSDLEHAIESYGQQHEHLLIGGFVEAVLDVQDRTKRRAFPSTAPVLLLDPVILHREKTITAALSVPFNNLLRGFWGEIRCHGTRLVRFPVTDNVLRIAAQAGITDESFRLATRDWTGDEGPIPVEDTVVIFRDAGVPIEPTVALRPVESRSRAVLGSVRTLGSLRRPLAIAAAGTTTELLSPLDALKVEVRWPRNDADPTQLVLTISDPSALGLDSSRPFTVGVCIFEPLPLDVPASSWLHAAAEDLPSVQLWRMDPGRLTVRMPLLDAETNASPATRQALLDWCESSVRPILPSQAGPPA